VKALTIWQPWASLTMLERPCEHPDTECIFEHPLDQPQRLKWIETRSWPAPASVIGQRIAIHAAMRWPKATDLHLLAGPFPDMATRPSIDAVGAQPCLPLGAILGTAVLAASLPMASPRWTDPVEPYLWVNDDSQGIDDAMADLVLYRDGISGENVDDQLPFGIFALGRWAWLLDDVRPIAQPITMRGFQGVWNVPAHIEERLAAEGALS
jgi:hypothetical protein